MTYDKYTNARKEANARYIKGKVDTVTIYIPKGKRQVLKDAAARAGVSMNKFIVSAIEEKLQSSLTDEL